MPTAGSKDKSKSQASAKPVSTVKCPYSIHHMLCLLFLRIKEITFTFVFLLKADSAAPSKAKQASTTSPSSASSGDTSALFSSIVAQGDLVRHLKTDKAPKDQVDAAVKQLMALKTEFKQLTGQEYKPGMAPPTSASALKGSAPTPAGGSPNPVSSSCPYTRVAEQGELVRKLKTEKAPKVCLYSSVLKLKML